MSLRTPRTQALAYRIWAYANARDWDVTLHELAEEFRENLAVIRAVVRHAGWTDRIRKTSKLYTTGNAALHYDDFISDLHDWS